MHQDQITELINNNFEKLQTNFPLYSRLNQKIKDKSGNLIFFLQNRMQIRLWNLLVEDLKSGKPVRWLIIKARQLGCTAWISALFYWLVTMNENKSALVVSYDAPSAQNILQKYQLFYLRSHKLLKPRVRRMNRELIHFATSLKDFEELQDVGLDSNIMVASADSVALGRSYTYQYIHLSEYALWSEYGIDIADRMDAVGQAIPDLSGTILIKETTAKGQNEVYDEWKDEFSSQRKIFISWIADEDYRINLNYLIDYFELSENPESRYGDEREERQAIIEQLQFWYPEESQKFEWLNHESMCRLAWRRDKIDNKFRGNKFKFKTEYPTTPDDAFNTSSRTAFSMPRLLEMEDELKRNKIVPQLYRYEHNDNVNDPKRKFYPAKYGHLRVYELPQKGQKYVIGGDGAQGIDGGDHSSLVILKLFPLSEVASFNDIISPSMFSGVCNFLGKFYNDALLGVERNDKGGFAAIEKLLDTYHYPNLFYHHDPLKYKPITDIKWGWITNEITRGIGIDQLRELIELNQIYIRSQEIINQCKSFVKNPKTGKYEASLGKKDDLVMALMIAVQLAKQVGISRISSSAKAPVGSFDWWMDKATKAPRGKVSRTWSASKLGS